MWRYPHDLGTPQKLPTLLTCCVQDVSLQRRFSSRYFFSPRVFKSSNSFLAAWADVNHPKPSDFKIMLKIGSLKPKARVIYICSYSACEILSATTVFHLKKAEQCHFWWNHCMLLEKLKSRPLAMHDLSPSVSIHHSIREGAHSWFEERFAVLLMWLFDLFNVQHVRANFTQVFVCMMFALLLRTWHGAVKIGHSTEFKTKCVQIHSISFHPLYLCATCLELDNLFNLLPD